MENKERIDYSYSPYPCQYKLHRLLGKKDDRKYEVCGKSDKRKRFMTLVAHRRMGKTTMGINHCIMDAVSVDPDSREHGTPSYALIYPERQQGKKIAWGLLKEFAQQLPGYDKNESDLEVEIFNGATISIVGAGQKKRIRGLSLDGVMIDEYKDVDPDAWREVIFPALTDQKGWAMITGTAGGRNHFYQHLEENSKDTDKAERWNTVVMPASDDLVNQFRMDNEPDYLESTNVFDEDDLQLYYEMMQDNNQVGDPDAKFKQEYGCQFQANVVGAYFDDYIARARKDEDDDPKRITKVPYESKQPVHTAWDLGISDKTAIWFMQKVGKEIRLIDYIEDEDKGLVEYFDMCRQKPYSYGTHIAPHDIETRDLVSGRSRKEIAASHGFNFKTLEKTAVDDRITAIRSILDQCWFDQKKCRKGIKALEEYRREYDKKKDVYKDKPVKNWASHGADAFGYLAQSLDRYLDKSNQMQQTVQVDTDFDVF